MQYFSYFSIDTSVLAAATLLVALVVAWRSGRESPSFTAVRMAALVYALVMAFGYVVIMRTAPSTGFATIDWPQWVMHVWVPAYIVLDWLLAPGRRPLAWRSVLQVLVFPTVWLVCTYTRGLLTGAYPSSSSPPLPAGAASSCTSPAWRR